MARETAEQRRERQHREDIQRLQRFRPIDDTFMRGMFQGNLSLAQSVLRIILGKDDLVLTRCETQADMKRVTGARSICLDAYGTDSEGKKYDIEVQRADHGSGPKRARYHSSVLDVENLDQKQDFDELPDTYVIFITENDVLKKGLPIYSTVTKIAETDEVFDDGRHIIYVNGQYRGDDPIGKLMHDFNCSSADEMKYPFMSERTKYLKETPKGVSEMCKIMEELRDASFEEGKWQRTIEMAIGMYEANMSIESIAQIAKVSVEQVKEWLADSEQE